MIATIVIVGGGQAGAQAIDTLRREGFRGCLILVGEEPQLPYQRPPLSKKYLSGEMAEERLPLYATVLIDIACEGRHAPAERSSPHPTDAR